MRIVSVFIGRFQPFHVGHLAVVEQALRETDHLIILIGSARSPRSYRNPWSFAERQQMIRDSLDFLTSNQRVTIAPLPDLYNDELWIRSVHTAVSGCLRGDSKIKLIGHAKDSSAYYLGMFPDWEAIKVANYLGLSGTAIRESYFSNMVAMWLNNADGHRIGDHANERLVPSTVKRFLERFMATPAYQYVRAEYEYINRYRQDYMSLPFPPTFVTVGACVVHAGYVLLVKRGGHPGKGLWALPGGFLGQDETVLSATMRELREETRVKVPEPVLRGSLVQTRVFDDPYRSARGRTITHASLIHLKRGTPRPPVKGSDDASEARWWKLSNVMPEMMFEDHFGIISTLVGSL